MVQRSAEALAGRFELTVIGRGGPIDARAP